MPPVSRIEAMSAHYQPDVVCDGGDLDCGSGLLLIIKKAMDDVPKRGVLEVRSRELSVAEDLPAWCRMVGHDFLDRARGAQYDTYFIRKHADDGNTVKEDLEAARGYRFAVRIRRQEGLMAKVYARNHSFLAGRPADFAAHVDAPAAVDFLLTALGSDLVVGLQSAASRTQLVFDEIELSLQAKLRNILYHLSLEDEGDPSVELIEGTLYVATLEEEAAVRHVWADVLRRSPMYQTLRKAAEIIIRLEVTL
ncbi:MAG: osmotically inducible protein OsmC [Alicyclobacillaceae bacterium]|uniref:sulfurtransferase TusA family protein n=1 Tax=Alicyclobacillus sp. SP_1 TaxID=2942475 RepID=UPI0021577D4D|nr:osmotically inducible protein OsmC [Alicyclobacillus sp. SP_1]MCY0888059.1 osmotically inducible protein OsmC [Alicyclobacillaceae bacterium]